MQIIIIDNLYLVLIAKTFSSMFIFEVCSHFKFGKGFDWSFASIFN